MNIPPYTSPLYGGPQDSSTDVITQSGSSEEVAGNRVASTAATLGEAQVPDLPKDTVSLSQTESSTPAAKLLRLQEAIKSNTYHVPTALLADKLIKAGVIKIGAGIPAAQEPN